jgi:hypothetical protein
MLTVKRGQAQRQQQSTGTATAAAVCVALACSCTAASTVRTTAPQPWPPAASVRQSNVSAPLSSPVLEPVAPVALDKLTPAAFADEDLDLPFYLAHFSELANSVESSGPNRGFININVWRGSAATHNARVMENVLSLAWFYTQQRAWNPYYAAPPLRARIEAALRFWSQSQGAEGQFSEYEPGIFGLAPTAFATKFFGEALILLRSGPPIDPAVLKAAELSLVKAVHVILKSPSLYATGRSFSNQFGNVWGGGLALLSFHPSDALRSLWQERFAQSRSDFQSPAGFYFENDGPDFEYTLHTHTHNSRQAWEWLRGTKLGEDLSEREAAWAEWLALNAVPEPRGGFTLNAAIATRKTLRSFRHHHTPLAEVVPILRVFAESTEEVEARHREERAQLVAKWPKVAPLPIGEFSAYSPYVFLHRRLQEWRPTTAERNAARAALPVLSRQRFTIQRRDSRKDATFTFLRRPSYYATFASGERASEHQRYGLGLIWSARQGAVMMSQPASERAAWGTVSETQKQYEAGNLNASFTAEGVPLGRAPHAELPTSAVSIRYPLGNAGWKRLKFDDTAVTVNIEHPGEFEELLPLLVPPDGTLAVGPRAVTLLTPRGRVLVRFTTDVAAALEPQPSSVADKKLVVVRLRGLKQLDYSIVVE